VEATFSQKPPSCQHLGHRRRLADSVGDPDDGKETGLREEDDAIPSMDTQHLHRLGHLARQHGHIAPVCSV
jgi:hypothetical protein